MVMVKDLMEVFTITLDGIVKVVSWQKVVCWNNGSSVGGHFVYNNTFFNSVEKNDIMVLNTQAGQNINYGSVVMNNLSETLSVIEVTMKHLKVG